MITLPLEHYDRAAVEHGLKSYEYLGQLEEGESTGYLHWQIYIENSNPIKFETLQKKFPKGHFEPRSKSKLACYRYVTKSESRVAGVEPVGSMAEPAGDGKGTTLEQMRDKMLLEGVTARDLLLTEPAAARPGVPAYLKELEFAMRSKTSQAILRDLEVTYIFGAPGIGKTSGVYEKEGLGGTLYSASSYRNPFDAYNYEPSLLLDEFAGQLEFEYLLKVLDRYPLQLACRYADKWACFTRVYLVSNLPLDRLYTDVQRDSPEQWNALCRRIHHYCEMTEPGVLVEREKPVRALGEPVVGDWSVPDR